MRDSKPQRCILQHKSLNVTQNATNGNKRINEVSKQVFANNLFKISINYTQGININLFQLEDLCQCFEYTNLGRFFWVFSAKLTKLSKNDLY